ncbi:hypothetical protein [Labrys neptuniae]
MNKKFKAGDIVVKAEVAGAKVPDFLKDKDGTFTVTGICMLLWGGDVLINLKHNASGAALNGVYAYRFKAAPAFPNGFRVGDRVQYVSGGKTVYGFVTDKTNFGSDDHKTKVWAYWNGQTVPSWMATSRVTLAEPVKAPVSGTKADLLVVDDLAVPARKRNPKERYYIAAVLDENGQPRPAKEPVVLTYAAQANKVAEDMAKRYPGQHFTVLTSTYSAFLPKAPAVETTAL